MRLPLMIPPDHLGLHYGRVLLATRLDSIGPVAYQNGLLLSRYQGYQLKRVLIAGLGEERFERMDAKGRIPGVDPFARDPKLFRKLEVFAKENVALIKDIGKGTRARVREAVVNAAMGARSNKKLAKELEELGFEKKRALFIARDQMGSLYGQLNAERQQALGVEEFIWRTMEDDRVRPLHQEWDGKKFRYDDPPLNEDGEPVLPGEDFGCRCYAEPVLTGLVGD